MLEVAQTCHRTHLEAREQLAWVCSLLLQCESQTNSRLVASAFVCCLFHQPISTVFVFTKGLHLILWVKIMMIVNFVYKVELKTRRS